MDKIRTATGLEFDCGFFAEASNGTLYFIVCNISAVEAVTVFYNRAETATLQYVVGGEVVAERTGYIINMDTVTQADGSVRIGLRRPFVGEEI